jgi:hypothetical protein
MTSSFAQNDSPARSSDVPNQSVLFTSQYFIECILLLLKIYSVAAILAAFAVGYDYLWGLFPFLAEPHAQFFSGLGYSFFLTAVTIACFASALIQLVFAFDFQKTRVFLWWILPFSLFCLAFYPVMFASGLYWWYYGLEFVGGYSSYFVVLLILVWKSSKRLEYPPLFKIYVIPEMIMVVIQLIYSFVFMPYFRASKTQFEQILLRSVVHPIMMGVSITAYKFFIKKSRYIFSTLSDSQQNYRFLPKIPLCLLITKKAIWKQRSFWPRSKL